MSSLTHNLHVACRKLVQEQLPHEALLFDHVWTAFWGALDCREIEELETNPHVSGEVSPVCVLGAVNTGRQELDTLFVLGAFVNTMVSIQRTQSKGEVTMDIITDTLKRECLNIDTPVHLQSVLFGHGTGLLAGLLGVEVPVDQIVDAIPAEQLWVEHCDKRGKIHEIPDITTGFFNKAEVNSMFRDKRKKYELFVDEFAPTIYLSQGNKFVPWSDMQARHKKLLGIILEALRNRQPIVLEIISDRLFSGNYGGTFSTTREGTQIRKALSELNHFFDGVFKNVIKAERSMDQYTVDGQITYCWIRPGDRSTRLLHSSPWNV